MVDKLNVKLANDWFSEIKDSKSTRAYGNGNF